ncbi:MAG: hypothetical protein IJ489_00260 [Clostridia bacterium]|nr:hypothetical protein [Clostridia bacterium]
MKRFLALTLALLMVLSVCMLAGCNNNNQPSTSDTSKKTETSSTSGTTASTKGNDDGTTTASQGDDGTTTGNGDSITETTTTEDTADTTPPGYGKLAGFEDVDFGGKTFVIAGDDGESDGFNSCEEIYSEEADAISVAVRERNLIMSQLYNCNIELHTSDNPYTAAMNEVTSNQHTIDFYNHQHGVANTATSGNNYNLYTLGIDFSNEWWDQQYVETNTLRNASGMDTLYSCIGDFSLISYACTHTLIFNKDVYENSPINDNVYELVKNKQWTMDKFMEMCKAAAKETSGNTTLKTSEGDILGWIRTGHATHGLHVASALSIIETRDKALYFEAVNNTAQWTTVIDKAIEVWSMPEGETLGYSSIPAAVAGGYTLFSSEILNSSLRKLKDYENLRVGLLPYPMYSESQENYAHYVDNHLYAYSVPTSVSEIDEMGKFIELFGYHSKYIVRTAWIDTYAYEYCSDPESAEMLDIILDTRTYDPGYLMFSVLEGDLSQMISSGQNNIAKWAERKANTVTGAGGYIENHMNGINDNET